MGRILDVTVAASSYEKTVDRCIEWARRRESRAVFFANVHMIMEAHDDAGFRARLNAADLVNPDGVPLVWALRATGEREASRVYGPDTTELLLKSAEGADVEVGFYGGSESTLETLLAEVKRRHPRLRTVFAMSPPYRALNADEDEEITQKIVDSGARMLFVGLGCPKQENWVMEHLGRVPAVMLGVGAAFDFLAGSKPQAPRWMMRNGMEWAFRLATEPSRLLVRYMKHNPRFVVLFLRQWMGQRAS